MAIIELFSSRQRKARGETPDVYQYDDIPKSLRVQIIHIVKATIGYTVSNPYCGDTLTLSEKAYSRINKILCKEYGVFRLPKTKGESDFEAIFEFFMNTQEVDKSLDIIELTFKYINTDVRQYHYQFERQEYTTQKPDDAIEELNQRFKGSGVGYEFISNEIVRIDSQYIHSEAVKPVLELLGKSKQYKGPNDEFLSAHEHYRHKRYKECLNDCLKSFESLMKAIHDKHSWNYDKNDTAKKLINSCLVKNLVPDYLQNQFSSIRTVLESGIPTVRNKEGGHGQGSEISEVPHHLANYVLHLTATNLLFLANCEEQYK